MYPDLRAPIVALFGCAIAMVIAPSAVRADEIKVISANGLRDVLADVTPAFERATGHRLATAITETGEIRQRILGGAHYDVIVLPEATADDLARQGHVAPASMIPVIRVDFGLAVRAGAPRPDTSSPAAFKQALLAAKSILITDPTTGGISGVHFMSVLERLGIAEEMKGRLVPHRGGGFHAERVVRGEAELAVQAAHEIRCISGAEFVPYPEEFRRRVVFIAGTGTRDVASGAAALLTFLRGPETAAAIKARCLAPG